MFTKIVNTFGADNTLSGHCEVSLAAATSWRLHLSGGKLNGFIACMDQIAVTKCENILSVLDDTSYEIITFCCPETGIIVIYDIYLTEIGLTPGGSSAIHIYTQTIHRTTQFTN